MLMTFPAWRNSSQLFNCTTVVLALLWAYSSPPLSLKERPVLDSLSNGGICWLFWACGYIFYENALFVSSLFASKHGWLVLLYGSALHSMAAMVDVDADTFAKYRTIATVYGEKFSALFSLIHAAA
jgi:4-hydroxybenzoate polyprenyltransferase